MQNTVYGFTLNQINSKTRDAEKTEGNSKWTK